MIECLPIFFHSSAPSSKILHILIRRPFRIERGTSGRM